MRNTLQVAPGLKLDADYIAGGSIALLGKRGAGKTYACRVLTEELHAAGVQTVIVDPMGVFWGLRAGADNTDGLPIPVFGGEHGDAPLESGAGHLMADLVVNDGLSMILDMSGFGSRTQERNFAGAFFDRLYRRNRDLVHLIIDEADLFAPQRPRGQDAPLLATMENIVRRGRNNGIGSTLATQRAAVLNKDVLTQVDALVALRVTAPQDRDAIRDWVRGQGTEDEWTQVAGSLAGLANGEAWWWVPEKGILQRAQVRPTHTFDSSPTRKRGQASRPPKTFADVDLAKITGQIAATIERAKENDPRELRRRIAELETAANKPATPTEPVVVKVLDADLVARAEAVAADIVAKTQPLLDAHAAAAQAVADLTAALRGAADAPTQSRILPTRSRASSPTPPAPRPAAAESTVDRTSLTGGLTPARQRLLDALGSLSSIGITSAPKLQLALWAGVSPKSSGYANNLGGLRTTGLIDYPTPGSVGLTPEGADRVDPAIKSERPSVAELHDHVRQLLTPARWRIVEALIFAFPGSISRDQLAGLAGASATSSGYANNLGGLRSLGLIDYPAQGQVVASPMLFLEV